MIPVGNPKDLPPGPYVLVEDRAQHLLMITFLKDWGDGAGPKPQLYSALASWKAIRTGPRGSPLYGGFRAQDVAVAHHLLALLNHDWECKA